MSLKIQNIQKKLHLTLISKLAFPMLLFMFYSFKKTELPGNEKSPQTRKELKLGGTYQRIAVTGNISIVLTNDPAGTVTIEGQEKNLSKVMYVLNNNKLSINVEDMNGSKQATIYLSALTLKELEMNGDGVITSVDVINSNSLHIFLNGIITAKIKTTGELNFDTPDDIVLHKKIYDLKKE